MQLLKSISEKEKKTVLYIPNQNFELNDYLSIIKTEKYRETVKKSHILGLDNFAHQTSKNELFANASLCVIPKGLSNPYLSEFITPFSEYESTEFINQIRTVELNTVLIKHISQYGSGFLKLTEKLLNYFIEHNNLSINNLLNDFYIQEDLNHIYDDFMKQVDNDVLKLWVGLIAVGKSLPLFSKSINNKIATSSYSLIQKLGFDRIVQSPLLTIFFQKKIGLESMKYFKREGVKEFLSDKNKSALGIWTANNELKFFDPNSNILNIASGIFKSETLIHRIDWEKSTINEKPIESKNVEVSFGSDIHFILGKRDAQALRTKLYKKINKQYKELIFKGDGFSKKGDLEKAEQCYKEIDNLKYDAKTKFVPDSNYGKIRMANLYRIQGRLDESISMCKPIIRSTPNPYAYLCWGICEFWRANFIESMECFDKSIIQNPQYANAKLWKVRTLLHINNFENAEDLLKDMKNSIQYKRTDDNSFVYIILNYLLFSNKEFCPKDKDLSWHNKALNFISSNQKKLPLRQIPLIMLYLGTIKNKEKEFSEIEQKYLTIEHSKGIQIDLYWWRYLFQNN